MSFSKTQKKKPRATWFEQFEPRLMMTAQAAATPDYQLDTSITSAAGATQATTQGDATSGREAYYQTAVDQVRSQYGLTGTGQTVVVIDTGIAYDDAALGGGFGSGFQVVGGWDFAENDANPYDDGPAGAHGTHVAGIIGSTDPNNLGVAPGVDLVALRVFDDGGGGYFSWIDSALRWVYDNRNSFRNPITTVNLSLGADWNAATLPAWANLENDLRLLKQAGIFISAAAGNWFESYGTAGLNYPAVSPYVVPVMSVGSDGQLGAESQRIDRGIAAPGENITSTVPDYAGNNNGVSDDWASFSGTSMSAAYVSGAAVLIRQALEQAGKANINEDAIYQIMRNTADRFFDATTNAYYLSLNLVNAVNAALHGPVDREGNSKATAVNLGTLDLQNTVSGSIDVAKDQDFYQFTASRNGTVTINIAPSAGVSTHWQLVNANGTLRTVTAKTLTLSVVAGKTYTFAVQSVSGMGAYELNFQLTPKFTGLGSVSAKTLNNQNVKGEKWYRFQTARGGTLAISSQIRMGTSDVTFELYNAAMQKIGTSTGDVTDLLDLATSAKSMYYIRVVGSNSKVQLKVACVAASSAPRTGGVGTASYNGTNTLRESSPVSDSAAAASVSPAVTKAVELAVVAEDSRDAEVFGGIKSHRSGEQQAANDESFRVQAAIAGFDFWRQAVAERSDLRPAPVASDAAGSESCVDELFGAEAADELQLELA